MVINMKKKVILTIIIVIGILGFYNSPLFTFFTYRIWSATDVLSEENKVWESEKPEITAYNGENTKYSMVNGTIKIGDKIIDTVWRARYHIIEVEDMEKLDNKESETVIFIGECKRNLWGNKLKIEVTFSNVDEIKVGDEIILNKQD